MVTTKSFQNKRFYQNITNLLTKCANLIYSNDEIKCYKCIFMYMYASFEFNYKFGMLKNSWVSQSNLFSEIFTYFFFCCGFFGGIQLLCILLFTIKMDFYFSMVLILELDFNSLKSLLKTSQFVDIAQCGFYYFVNFKLYY